MVGLLKKLKAWARDEDGNQTVEAALWIPVFTLFVVLVIDVSTIYNRQSEIRRIVQDGNRALATGRLEDAAAAQAFIAAEVARIGAGAVVLTRLTDGVIQTDVSIPASALMPLGTLPAFADSTVVVSSRHLSEF